MQVIHRADWSWFIPLAVKAFKTLQGILELNKRVSQLEAELYKAETRILEIETDLTERIVDALTKHNA